MSRKSVGRSIYPGNDFINDPLSVASKTQYFGHRTSFAQIVPFFPGLKKEEVPDGAGRAIELASLCTYNGTHLDAPYHFHSTMSEALDHTEASTTDDELSLDWCFQPGVNRDFRHFADGYVATAINFAVEFACIEQRLSAHELAVVSTGAGNHYGAADRLSAGRDIGCCRLEKMQYLDALPATDLHITCFSPGSRGASAGWIRAAATFNDRFWSGCQ